MNIDGSNQAIVKDDPNGNYSDYDPNISPDGLKLLSTVLLKIAWSNV